MEFQIQPSLSFPTSDIFGSNDKFVLREVGVILIVVIKLWRCFVEIFGAAEVRFFRLVSDVALLYLCFLKWQSNYSDEELFPGVDSEISDKILRNLKANRRRSKRWKVLFDVVSILPHHYLQSFICSSVSQFDTLCESSINLRWLRLLYIFRLPKPFETIDHLLGVNITQCCD